MKKKLRAFSYYIQDKDSSERHNRVYPLTAITVKELKHPVITVTGAVGFAIVATVTREGQAHTATESAVAVWHPSDKYSFDLGCKIALKRALKQWTDEKSFHKQAFRGLMLALAAHDNEPRAGVMELRFVWELNI